MVSSPIARIVVLLACAVLAYHSAGVTSASQQSPNSTSVASASFISAPASLSSKTVKNPYRRIFPVRELKARSQPVEIAPNPSGLPSKAPNNPEIICGLKVFHPEPDADAKIRLEPPKNASEFSIRRLQPKICQ
jgi:hypothetical protein